MLLTTGKFGSTGFWDNKVQFIANDPTVFGEVNGCLLSLEVHELLGREMEMRVSLNMTKADVISMIDFLNNALDNA